MGGWRDDGMSEEELAARLPLTPAVYHVLLGLGRDRLHGYAIMQAFERLTGGAGQLLPGTLYATLARMVESGLLTEVEPPEESGDARRRFYSATSLGRALAAAETTRLRRLVSVAERQRIAPEPGS